MTRRGVCKGKGIAMGTITKSRVALAAFGAALLLALTCVFAMPAHAASTTYTQTKLGYQSQAITLQKGAVKLEIAAGASTSDVGIFTQVDASGYGKNQIVHAYATDPYGKEVKYGNVAKTGTYYIVFYASTYSGATGTKATVTSYPFAQKTITVGKTATGTGCGDYKTVAYYKIKVAKRGLLSVDVADAAGGAASASVRICNAKKKAFTSSDGWSSLYDGRKAYYGVKKGTYFLAVKSGTSLYKVTPKLTAVTKAGGEKKAKAVSIAKGKTMKGVLAAGEKARWYKFKVTKSKKYTFAMTDKTDPSGLKLTFSGEGYYDGRAYLYSPSNADVTFKTEKLKPGTYYIKVEPFRSSGTGGNGYFTIRWK